MVLVPSRVAQGPSGHPPWDTALRAHLRETRVAASREADATAETRGCRALSPSPRHPVTRATSAVSSDADYPSPHCAHRPCISSQTPRCRLP